MLVVVEVVLVLVLVLVVVVLVVVLVLVVMLVEEVVLGWPIYNRDCAAPAHLVLVPLTSAIQGNLPKPASVPPTTLGIGRFPIVRHSSRSIRTSFFFRICYFYRPPVSHSRAAAGGGAGGGLPQLGLARLAMVWGVGLGFNFGFISPPCPIPSR